MVKGFKSSKVQKGFLRLPMAARDLPGLTALYCPNCKGGAFMFSGLQKGYGYSPDIELWTCRQCHSTFSEKSLGLKKGVVQGTRMERR